MPPAAAPAAEGRQVAQVVEPPAGVEELLVVAPLDPRGVGAIEQAAGEAGAQPRRRAPGEPVRDQPARQDREGREHLPPYHRTPEAGMGAAHQDSEYIQHSSNAGSDGFIHMSGTLMMQFHLEIVIYIFIIIYADVNIMFIYKCEFNIT